MRWAERRDLNRNGQKPEPSEPKKKVRKFYFRRLWERGSKAAALAVFLAVMFFAGRGAGYAKRKLTSQTEVPVLYAENWGLGFGASGTKPTGNASAEELEQYGAYFVGKGEEKVIYLTFDCGYENGNTPAILDALAKHQAKGAFFVVGHFLESAPELVKRMAEEGHTVGNHTWHHPDMTAISSLDAFREELDSVAERYREITGAEISPYYRPPQGKYSVQTLQMANELGYSTCFWSLAYVDWNVENQPTHEQAFSKLIDRIHPGAVVLLHNTSKTNGEILDELLGKWEAMGYRFGTLDELTGKSGDGRNQGSGNAPFSHFTGNCFPVK